MKNIQYLTVLVFLTLFCNKIDCQQTFGVSSGANISNILWKNLEESGWQYKPGWFIGVNSKLVIKDKIEILSEIQFSNKGWGAVNSIGLKESFEYLDVLTTIKYKPLEIVGIYTGVNIGLLLNDPVWANRLFDPGFIIGLNIKISKIEFFGHYNESIMSVFSELPENLKVVNSNFQFGLRLNIYSKKNHQKSSNNTP